MRTAARRLFLLLFLVADGLLLGLFLAGYVARYIPPRFLWWTELVAIGLPYLSLLLVPGGIVLALVGKWRWLIVHVVFLLMALFRFDAFHRVWPVTADPSDVLTVMTFNFPESAGGVTVREQRRRVAEIVETHRPDIIALQDVKVMRTGPRRFEARPHVSVLFDSLGYRVSTDFQAAYRATDQPVFGKVEMGAFREILLRKDPSDLLNLVIVRVPFTWQGREAVLYNLHLRSFGYKKPWTEDNPDVFSKAFWRPYWHRYRDAFQIRSWEVEQVIEMASRETLPLIVCGDFNSTPHNWAYGRLRSALGLRDAFLEAGAGWGATYHSGYPLVRIDFVLASPEWEVVSAEAPGLILSDHRPVVARLRWKDP